MVYVGGGKYMARVLGIDIGGTKILGGIIDKSGTLIKSIKVDSEAKVGRDALLKNLFKCIDSLLDEEIQGIGVCSPGFVNYDNGIIEFTGGNMTEWSGCKLREILEERYKLPVVVENDANAAAFGEFWMGAAKGKKNFVMLSLGTGLGGAIITNSQLCRGAFWCAGEFGHAILVPEGKQCACGEKGCLELYASGTAIYERYNELIGQKVCTGAKEVFDLLEKNDKLAIQVIDEFALYISIALKNIKRYIDPEVIVIGGGLIDAKEFWWEKVLALISRKLIIVPAELGSNAAMFGAANLFFNDFCG